MTGNEAGGLGDEGAAGEGLPRGSGGALPARRAIVVGTGFGGAVTACRLAQAGFDVELLERGRRYGLSDFPVLPKDGELLPDARRWTWPGSRGLWDLRNLDGVSIAQAAGYGGGSLIYANVHLRPPIDVFDAAWPQSCRGRAGLEDYYDLVGSTLDIKPVPVEWRTTGKTGIMADAFRAATNGEPLNVFFPPLAINYPENPTVERPEPPTPVPEHDLDDNPHGRKQGVCQRCGACDFGCRYGAKNTLDRNYLAKAEATGNVTVRTLAEVLEVSRIPGGYRVDYKDHLIDASASLEAPYVFLCAGAVNTTELLLRSIAKGGIPFPHPAQPADPFPGQHYFFNADAPAMVFDTEKDVAPSAGPVITTALIYWNDSCPVRTHDVDAPGRQWFLIEDGGYPAAAANLFSLFRTPLLLGRNRFDPSREPPQTLTELSAGNDPARPDRYPAFLGGMLAALRDGTLPNVLPPTFESAVQQLLQLAGPLRDDEVAEVTEAIRDAVILKSGLFRLLRFLRIDRWARPLWRLAYRTLVRIGALGRVSLLETTLDVTHHRYGVDDPKGFPNRVGRALMGERYPVSAAGNPFDRKLPAPPASSGSRRAMLLAMGRDDLPATLKLEDDRLVAEFKDVAFPTLTEEERVMRGIADALRGTLRANPLWTLARRPLSAHSHGGCTLGQVTDEWGELKHNPNLFINDGALLPSPVGVNPSSTIAALAERNVEHFVLRTLGTGPLPWQNEIDDAKRWKDRQNGVSLSPPIPRPVRLTHDPIGFSFVEAMQGYLAPVPAGDISRLPDPKKERVPVAQFLVPEHAARGGPGTGFELRARVRDIGWFLNDKNHRISFEGTLSLPLPPGGGLQQVAVTAGFLNLLADVAPHRRVMQYELPFTFQGGSWTLKGMKEIEDDAGFDAWLDTSVLYTELFAAGSPNPVARGILRLGIKDFLDNQIKGLQAEGTTDPARVIWTLGSFAVFFFGDLQGIYAPEIKRFRALFGSGWRALPAAVQKATPKTARLLRGL